MTAFYYVTALGQMAEIATALGRATDAAAYGSKHNAGVRAYHARYFDAAAGGYPLQGGGLLTPHVVRGAAEWPPRST